MLTSWRRGEVALTRSSEGMLARGSPLANLYLQGKSVPQSCEQAHMLLQTAATKGSKAADTLLKSSYPERCE